jgi:hypothetical protein
MDADAVASRQIDFLGGTHAPARRIVSKIVPMCMGDLAMAILANQGRNSGDSERGGSSREGMAGKRAQRGLVHGNRWGHDHLEVLS